jgi:uncharacterized protein with HEPN domain
MLRTIDSLQHVVEGETFEQFLADEKTQFAVARGLSIIGEAANRLSTPLKQRYPYVAWAMMVGMRHRLVH